MPKSIRILAIESSCDETAAAVLEDGVSLKSSVVASQMAAHVPYGGVVPELASREHLRNIVPVVRGAVEQAGIRYADIDAIAVTQGPGLVGALMVGLVYAKSLAMALGKPLIAVNHLEGHIFAVLLEERLHGRAEPELPALSLLVSGGHTLLAVSKALDAPAGSNAPGIDRHVMQHRIVARTRDDAAGEAFDKVAKLLGLGYPGGPVIDKLARLGDPRAVPFTRARMKGNALDFSFSGIKTAVLRYVESNRMAERIAERNAFRKANPKATIQELAELCEPQTRDLIASFQHSVVDELVRHTLDTAANEPVNSVFVSGGVAANSLLRERFMNLGGGAPPVFFPRMGLSTDNAAMIAAAAYPRYLAGEFAGWNLSVDPSLTLEP